jgi:hypothetical protein
MLTDAATLIQACARGRRLRRLLRLMLQVPNL